MKTNTLLLFLLFTFSFSISNGQDKRFLKEKKIWYPGTLKLLDGEILEGEINYDFYRGVINKKNKNSFDVYHPSIVTQFEIVDSLSLDTIQFYSLPFQTTLFDSRGIAINQPSFVNAKNKGPYSFFEVIYEKRNLALISKNVLESKETQLVQNNLNNLDQQNLPNEITIEKVFQVLFLVNNKGENAEYAYRKREKHISHKSSSPNIFDLLENKQFKGTINSYDRRKHSDSDNLKFHILDNKSAFEKVMTYRNYSKVKNYMKSNKIKGKTLGEIIQVIDYHSSL